MSDVTGTASDARRPWGVLGTSTPLEFPVQGGFEPVAAVGIEGVSAESADSIGVYQDRIASDAPGLPVGAGVHGVLLGPVSGGDSVDIEGSTSVAHDDQYTIGELKQWPTASIRSRTSSDSRRRHRQH
jgi:hypothetical protein